MSIITDVREGEFAENAAVRLRRKRLVRARVKAHPPAVSAKQERTSYGLIRSNEYPRCNRYGWRAVMAKVDSHPGLSMGAE